MNAHLKPTTHVVTSMWCRLSILREQPMSDGGTAQYETCTLQQV